MTTQRDAAARPGNAWWGYAVAATGSVVLATLWLRPWQLDANSVLSEGVDNRVVGMAILAIADAGPFGVTEHLAWPAGYSHWSLPLLGPLLAFVAWLSAGWLGISVPLTMSAFLVIAAACNGAATLFFFRAVTSRYAWLSVVLAVAVGASVFTLTKLAHFNVALYAVVPLALGVVLRWPWASRVQQRRLVVLLGLATAVLPVTWSIMILPVLALLALPDLARQRWANAGAVLWPTLAVAAGVAFQWVCYLVAAVPGGSDNRGVWDSVVFGGHLLDLVRASPMLNQLVPALANVAPGVSKELSPVGLFGMLTATVTVLAVLVLPRPRGRTVRVLLSGSVATLLFFLVGGLGPVQAAAFAVFGESSPSRVWARLVIVLTLLGCGWLLVWLGQRSVSPRFAGVLAVCVLGLWLWDGLAVNPRPTLANSALPEYGAVTFLRAERAPCPVAQFPLDSSPSPTHMWGLEQLYRGAIPALLAPEFFWSFGDQAANPLRSHPGQLTQTELAQLRRDGYCAVLFDQAMAAALEKAGVTVPGGSVAPGLEPQYRDGRYAVFLV